MPSFELIASQREANTMMLFTGIRAAQEQLGKRVDRCRLTAKSEDPIEIDLQRFAANLKTAWQAGETRPTHSRPYRRTKPYPKRSSMLASYEMKFRACIEPDPTTSAAAVLQSLMNAVSSRFTKNSDRTVQIAVTAWRAEITGQIIVNRDWMMSVAMSSSNIKGHFARRSTSACRSSTGSWIYNYSF